MDLRKIDSLVAEHIMGLEVRYEETWMDFYLGTGPERCPYYSIDIRDAWDVVEKLKNLDPYIRIYEDDDGDGFWLVDFMSNQSMHKDITIAICLAALKTKEIECHWLKKK